MLNLLTLEDDTDNRVYRMTGEEYLTYFSHVAC